MPNNSPKVSYPLHRNTSSNQYLFHCYLWSVVLVGSFILLSHTRCLLIQSELTQALLFQLAVWAIIASLSELKPVQLNFYDQITVSFAVHIAAIIYFGTAFALIIGAIGSIVIDTLGKRGILKTLFNVGQYSITISATGFAFYGLKQTGPGVRLDILQDFFVILVACAVYAGFNWVLVSTVIALTQKQRFRDVLFADFKALGSHYVAEVPLGILMVFLYQQHPILIILLALPLMMTHNAIEHYMAVSRQARETIELLSDTIDERDSYTANHSKRVAEYARNTAAAMNLKTRDIQEIYMAGRVHDLGKISIPDAILLKPGRLTAEEFEAIKAHPKISFFLLNRIQMYGEAAKLALYHHERFDGKGYPTGLKAESIPLGARILAVADSFDAMTTDRPYRRALSASFAAEELRRGKGTQFDPDVVEAFLSVIEADNNHQTADR